MSWAKKFKTLTPSVNVIKLFFCVTDDAAHELPRVFVDGETIYLGLIFLGKTKCQPYE